jgi:hypothetical protein
MNKEDKIIVSEPVEINTSHAETGKPKPKTISQTVSMLKGAAAVVAGIAVKDFITMTGEPMEADPADTAIAVTSDTPVEWDPSTAPKAGEGIVSDSMSFDQAFAAARQELGPGGVFVWQGEAYHTFYAEETTGQFETGTSHDTETSLPGNDHLADNADNVTESTPAANADTSAGTMAETGPAMIAADLNADGEADILVVDYNLDGSADTMTADLNADGIITEDEVIVIHDPESLIMPEVPSDGSVISVDVNADGMDDILVADLNNDQMADLLGTDENRDQEIDQSEIQVLNPEAWKA